MNRRGFSLIELVIVIVILDALTAIALPRLSRGSQNADVATLKADLSALRGAIEMYRVDHGEYPAFGSFSNRMTELTTPEGTFGPTADLGPYLVSFPALPVGTYKGTSTVKRPTETPPVAEVINAGWLYDEDSASIWANALGYLDL